MNSIIGACKACGHFDDLRSDLDFFITRRCASCRIKLSRKKYGSVLVKIAAPMTQRELAEVKREVYQTEKMLFELDKRRQEFIQRAMAEADEMVKEVEAQLGKPLKDVRVANTELKGRLKTFMQASGQNEMRIRDMLVTLKEQVINAGNKPLWTQITSKMGELLRWTEEELQTFIKANYSSPQHGTNLSTQFLPPGKRKKPAVYQLDMSTNRHATINSIQDEWVKTGDKVCRVNDCGEMFILTGKFVQKNGLATMIQRQATTKKSLSITDVEQKDERSFVMVEGQFCFDPNTVRAFLADRFPDREVSDVFPLDQKKIAVELMPEGQSSPGGEAMDFFGRMNDIVDSLIGLEQARGDALNAFPNDVFGRNQSSTPDNIDDLSLTWERNQPAGGNNGSFGNGAQEGIMTPEGTSPLIQTSGTRSVE